MGDNKVIDVHSHILPGMDDGSENIEMSLSMLQSLAEQGVPHVCATPHYYADRETIEHFLERRTVAVRQLTEYMENIRCSVILGAEVTYFKGMGENRQLDLLCMQGTKCLLLEMPFMEWNRYQVEEVISLVLDRGYHVILAHPERFLFSKHNEQYLEKLAELPISLQVNAETLLRLRTRRKGLGLLQMTNSPLLGSDCHNMDHRAPYIEKARKVIGSRLGEEFINFIDENAAKVLAGAVEVTKE